MPTLYDNFERVRQYIDQHQGGGGDMSAYVTKDELSAQSYLTSVPSEYITDAELSACGYVTMGDVSACGYITSIPSTYASYNGVYSYLHEMGIDKKSIWGCYIDSAYITDSDLSGDITINGVSTWQLPTYAAISNMGYVTSNDLPVINENIIPKETGTYTLGDSSHIYSNTYSRGVYLGTGIRMFSESSASSNDMAISLGGVSYFYLNTNRFAPNGAANNEKLDLGTADRKWNHIYGKSVNVGTTYTNTAYLQDTSYSSSIVPKETGTYTLGDVDHFYARTYTGGIQSGSGGLAFRIGNSNTAVFGGGDFRPSTDGAQSLGRSSNHWNNGYINNIFTNTAYLQDTSYTKSIVPAENNAYTLGDSTYFYSTSYVTDLWTSIKNRISNRSDNQINIQLNNGWKYTFHSNGFSPATTNQDSGNVYPWRSTYTTNLYADNAYISNYNNLIWTGTSAEYAALSDYTTYQIYMIKEA